MARVDHPRLLQRSRPKRAPEIAPARQPVPLGVEVLEGRDAPSAAPAFAIGAAPGSEPYIYVYDAQGTEVTSFLAYEPDFTGGTRVAVADLSGDGTPDIVTGAGPGGGPRVRAFDGATGAVLLDFFAYEETFTGGIWVAAGPVGGGVVGIATGADAGGGPRVRVFDDGGAGIQDFFAYDQSFAGGVRVALGQDGTGPRVYTTPGDGLDPTVRGFDVGTGSMVFEQPAGPVGAAGGTLVAAGDLDGDGADDVFTAAADAAGTDLRVFSGASGALVDQATLDDTAYGLGALSWDGQPAFGVLGASALTAYALSDLPGGPVVLGQMDASGWGGAGASVGGTSVAASGNPLPSLPFTETVSWEIRAVDPMFDPNVYHVNVTVTVDLAPGDPGRYLWTYELENTDFDQPAVNVFGGLGWYPDTADVTETHGFYRYPDTLWWESGHLPPGETATFTFTTAPRPIVDNVASAFDQLGMYYSMPGFVKGPGEVPTIDLRVAGLDDATEDQAPGKKIHINDNFDEDQQTDDALVSDHLADPATGKHQIKDGDADLASATLHLNSAVKDWALLWTIDPKVKVWYKEWQGANAGKWLKVANTTFINTPVPAQIDLRLEGVDIGAGSVKVELSVNGGELRFSDEAAFTVYTGLKLTGTKADAAKGQVTDATGWTLNRNPIGDVWRTGGVKNPPQWQTDAQTALDSVFKNEKQTAVGAENRKETVVGSFIRQEVDPNDIAVFFAADRR
ncbi:MAG TPA: hypothetical protein VIL46_06180, partial [Gemmataceae bacterium]